MILISPKGKEMIKTVSPIYYQSKIMQGIFQSIGMEYDNLDKITDDIALQLFPQTATWGLVYWEELLKIPVNETVDIERRRALVMTRMKLRSPMTPKRISSVVSALTKGQSEYVEVTENLEPHVFMVNIGVKGQGVDYLDVYRTIKRIKPSHESFYLGSSYLRGFSLNSSKIYGFSKIIHAIGTFLTSKEDVEFIAIKGHRNVGKVGIKKNKVRGIADPLVCSKSLVSRIDGYLNEENMKILKKKISGMSDPLVCSKSLIYEIEGFLNEKDTKVLRAIISGVSDPKTYSKEGFLNNKDMEVLKGIITGISNPLICSEELKYTILGILNDELINEGTMVKKGSSKPVVCSKNLKFIRIEVV